MRLEDGGEGVGSNRKHSFILYGSTTVVVELRVGSSTAGGFGRW